MRFETKADCYLDIETGLEWSLENYGSMSWKAAVEFVKKLPSNSSSSWRLPTVKELLKLINYEIHNPATELPEMVAALYWSTTISAYGSGYIWGVDFDDGHGNWLGKSGNYYVRCVRD